MSHKLRPRRVRIATPISDLGAIISFNVVCKPKRCAPVQPNSVLISEAPMTNRSRLEEERRSGKMPSCFLRDEYYKIYVDTINLPTVAVAHRHVVKRGWKQACGATANLASHVPTSSPLGNAKVGRQPTGSRATNQRRRHTASSLGCCQGFAGPGVCALAPVAKVQVDPSFLRFPA